MTDKTQIIKVGINDHPFIKSDKKLDVSDEKLIRLFMISYLKRLENNSIAGVNNKKNSTTKAAKMIIVSLQDGCFLGVVLLLSIIRSSSLVLSYLTREFISDLSILLVARHPDSEGERSPEGL